MWHEKECRQQHRYPDFWIFQQFEVRKEDKPGDKYGHVFAIEHSGKCYSERECERPCRGIEVVLVEVEEECGEEEQRCVRGGDKTICREHH